VTDTMFVQPPYFLRARLSLAEQVAELVRPQVWSISQDTVGVPLPTTIIQVLYVHRTYMYVSIYM
jgi:hypothetical protein